MGFGEAGALTSFGTGFAVSISAGYGRRKVRASVGVAWSHLSKSPSTSTMIIRFSSVGAALVALPCAV